MRIRQNTNADSPDFDTRVRTEIKDMQDCLSNRSSSSADDSCFCQPESSGVPGYIVDSFFDRHVSRWLQHFRWDQFLFLSSARFVEDTAGVMKTIETFVGLPHHDYGDVLQERLNSRGEEETEASFLDPVLKNELKTLFEQTVDVTYALTEVDLTSFEMVVG